MRAAIVVFLILGFFSAPTATAGAQEDRLRAFVSAPPPRRQVRREVWLLAESTDFTQQTGNMAPQQAHGGAGGLRSLPLHRTAFWPIRRRRSPTRSAAGASRE
jgi:hypothetical protein